MYCTVHFRPAMPPHTTPGDSRTVPPEKRPQMGYQAYFQMELRFAKELNSADFTDSLVAYS